MWFRTLSYNVLDIGLVLADGSASFFPSSRGQRLWWFFERSDFILRFTYSRIILVNLLQYTTILGVTNPIFDDFWSNFEQFLFFINVPCFLVDSSDFNWCLIDENCLYKYPCRPRMLIRSPFVCIVARFSLAAQGCWFARNVVCVVFQK